MRTIKRQIWAACSGVQEAVDSLQTSTGMKDKMALFWIDKLIVKARETQKERIDADPRLKDKTLNGEARKSKTWFSGSSTIGLFFNRKIDMKNFQKSQVK